MAIEMVSIKVGEGPEELAKGKQALADTLRSAWSTLQDNPSLPSPIISLQFGATRESWFRVSRSVTGEPQIGYADKDHLAMLMPLKNVINQFLEQTAQPKALTPFVLKNYLYDIDEKIRIDRSLTGESYPPGSPLRRLTTEDPAVILKQQQSPLPLDLEAAADRSPGRLGLFYHSEQELAANKPALEPASSKKKPTPP